MTTNARTHQRPSTSRRVLVAWITGCASVLLLLLSTGADRPGSPPVTDPSSWRLWWTSREPIDAVAGVARLVAIALVVYLMIVTAVQLLCCCPWATRCGELGRLGRTARIARAVGPRFLAGLTAAAVLGSAPGVAAATADSDKARTESSPATPGAGATMEVVVDTPASTATTVVVAASSALIGVHTSLPWAHSPPVPPTQDPPADSSSVRIDPLVAPTASASNPVEVEVRPGDHLWSLAETEVSRRLARPATRDEIDRYWRQVIETNRDRLPQSDNPDLIFPGQSLLLP